eukprot:12581115-Alexandrium_andersonii.AAC.1
MARNRRAPEGGPRKRHQPASERTKRTRHNCRTAATVTAATTTAVCPAASRRRAAVLLMLPL